MNVVARQVKKGLFELLKAENPNCGMVVATVQQLNELKNLPSLNLVKLAVKLIPLEDGRYAAVPDSVAYGTAAVAIYKRPSELKNEKHLVAAEGAYERISLELRYDLLSEQLVSAEGNEFNELLRERADISVRIHRRGKTWKKTKAEMRIPMEIRGVNYLNR